ncbi:MAG: hypothetical protein ACI8WB_002151, partial [Phenylobacterium sp.]
DEDIVEQDGLWLNLQSTLTDQILTRLMKNVTNLSSLSDLNAQKNSTPLQRRDIGKTNNTKTEDFNNFDVGHGCHDPLKTNLSCFL